MKQDFKGSPTPWVAFNVTNLREVTKQDVKHNDGSHYFFSKTINVVSSENKVLCEVKAYTTELFEDDFDKWEANCHLIMAAPDLLATCQDLYSQLIGMLPNIEETSVCKDAMKAINKALNR